MHALWHQVRSHRPLDLAWQEAAAWMFGEAGYLGPWPHTTQLIADYAVWERVQQLALLRHAEVCVISPAAHSAVMAAAMILDPADLLTLDRDTDIPLRTGLVALPEPVVLLSRDTELGDLSVLGWTFNTMYGPAGEEFPAVGVSGMSRPAGPTGTPSWEEFLAEAKAGGHPIPPWFPAGTNGMRADASSRTTLEHAEATVAAQGRRMLHSAVGDLAGVDHESAPHTAQWNGEPIEDPYRDFPERYLFAFWRLAAQGVTTATGGTAPPTGGTDRPGSDRDPLAPDPGSIRLIDLRRSPDRSRRTGESFDPPRYSHRWPVRMHKVRQWYPSLGRHRILLSGGLRRFRGAVPARPLHPRHRRPRARPCPARIGRTAKAVGWRPCSAGELMAG